MGYSQEVLEAAEPEYEAVVRRMLAESSTAKEDWWADLQQTFLDVIDGYLDRERRRDPRADIDPHEAGGHLRIAFPHVSIRDALGVVEHLGEVMAARKAYTDETLVHGFSDEAEVHHEIETFLYFQTPCRFLPGMAG